MAENPDLPPREGDIWAKVIVQVKDGPAHILDLPDGDPRINETITFVYIDRSGKELKAPEKAPGSAFRHHLKKNPRNGYQLLKEPIWTHGMADNLVIYHVIEKDGSLDPTKKSMHKNVFAREQYILVHRNE